MKKAIIAIVIIAALITAGFFIFGIYMFASVSEYEETFTYYYTPDDVRDVENFNAYASVSEIRVRYNKTNTDHVIKAEMHFNFRGPLVEGQSYTEFFEPIIWENSTEKIRFSLENKPDTWTFPMAWFGMRNSTLTLTLRTDVVYNLSTTADVGSVDFNGAKNVVFSGLNIKSTTGSVKANFKANTIITEVFNLETTTGSVELYSSHTKFMKGVNLKTSTGSVDLYASKCSFGEEFRTETTTGSTLLNLTSCDFGGDIQAIVTTGSVDYNSYNSYFKKNLDLSIESTTGSVNMDIIHYNEIGANITGTISTTTGSVEITYKDTSPEVGAYFEGETNIGEVEYPGDGNGFTEAGTVYFSNDYPTSYNYEFYLSTNTGSVEVVGESS